MKNQHLIYSETNRRLIYKYLSEIFSHVTGDYEIYNFPPLFIYEAIK